VTINTMTAGERVFVDLLPDSWSGQPPPAAEVVRELAERARAAERALRQQRATADAKKRAPVRVRASVQPTFVRFVFEMPDGVGVSSVLNDQKLTLLFNAALTFDLRRQGGGAVEHRLDQPEDRGRRGGSRADRRCRCPFLPRGQELHRRRRFPASGKAFSCRSPAAARRHAGPASATARRTAPPAAQSGEIVPPTSETRAAGARIESKSPAPKRRRSHRRSKRRRAAPIVGDHRPSKRPRRRQNQVAAASKAGEDAQRLPSGGQARQRRPAPDVFLCRRRRRRPCSAAPIRCGWCSIPESRSTSSRSAQGRRDHRRRQPAAAGKGPGDPHSPQPSADAVADGRGQAGELDADLCRRCKRRRSR
jgi:hypothetical protein